MKPCKVLLIDDNQDMLSIGEQIFSGSGYQFFSADTGKEGLTLLKANSPDVVVLDYLLPDMKGGEIIGEVATSSEYDNFRTIPFLVLTAWDEDVSQLDHLYRNGLVAYLTKPFGHRELRCVVENVVNRQRAIGNPAQKKPAEQPQVLSPSEELTDLANSVVGLAHTLLEDLEGELLAEQRNDLNAIFNCGRRLLTRLEPPAPSRR